ncbi:MAG TPA: PQQ-binding-like beta-propeller repeat protein [Verrucomicrobiae bacterium]|nr:PQQ-binding-like beta-propeller repeat protein [Verrucomicrobiae bacterium]
MIRVLFALLCLACTALAADHWPQFRGPTGDGHATARNLPTTWTETENVRWKTPIHGKAWSSPVVWGDQIWVTTAPEDGTQLFAVCIDRNAGKIIHDLKLFDVPNPQFCHKFNSYASPTPVIEEGCVYITFGSPGTACLDTKSAKVLWERRDIECNHYRAAGSSPILYGDLLILAYDGSDHQFIMAFDKRTGKTVWRTNRSIDYKDLGPDGKPQAEGDFRKAFATAHVADIDGKPTLLSIGAKAFYAYEPLTGQDLWRVEERTSHSAGTRPVVGHGLIFVPSGWSSGFVLAIRPGKKGETLDANAATNDSSQRLQVAWKTKRNVPKKPSLLLIDDLLYMIDEGGIATCVEAKTGAEVWRERIGGNYSASPIYADGNIYLCSEEGKTTVLKPGRQFAKVAENTLPDGFMASPAAVGNALYLRTRTHLYCIEKIGATQQVRKL